MADTAARPYPGMGPGRGAARPSCLAVNPNNVQASADRRAKLLAAFDALPPDTRADLLELAESWAFGGFWSFEKGDARTIFAQVFNTAGWGTIDADGRYHEGAAP